MTALGKLFGATAFRLALAILVLSAVGSGVVLYIIAWQVESVVDKEIARTVDAEAKGLIDTFDNAGIRRLYAVIEARKREPGASLYLLTNPIGEPLAGNVEQIPAEVLLHPGFVPIFYRGTGSSERGREALVGVYILPGGFRLLIGHDLGDRARIGKVMVRALAISLVFFAALGAAGALFVARRVLKRIDDMNTSAHGIMAGDLTRRLPVSGSGDELDRLAEGLNEMLGRISELMEGLREVSDNIAHDLRTPLTRLRNHAEAALAFGGDAAAYRQGLEKTIEESDGLIRIFNALLLIARAEAGGDLGPLQPVDVGEAAMSVAELYEPIAEEEGLALTVHARDGLKVRGNRELIGQAIANLVDNAIKYGAPNKESVGSRDEARRGHHRGAGRPIGPPDGRRPRSGNCSGGPGARARPVRPARRVAVAARLRARAFARRGGCAHARRIGRARGQSARASRPSHLARGGRAGPIPRARRTGPE